MRKDAFIEAQQVRCITEYLWLPFIYKGLLWRKYSYHNCLVTDWPPKGPSVCEAHAGVGTLLHVENIKNIIDEKYQIFEL